MQQSRVDRKSPAHLTSAPLAGNQRLERRPELSWLGPRLLASALQHRHVSAAISPIEQWSESRPGDAATPIVRYACRSGLRASRMSISRAT
jgi:hypothetical protein